MRGSRRVSPLRDVSGAPELKPAIWETPGVSAFEPGAPRRPPETGPMVRQIAAAHALLCLIAFAHRWDFLPEAKMLFLAGLVPDRAAGEHDETPSARPADARRGRGEFLQEPGKKKTV